MATDGLEIKEDGRMKREKWDQELYHTVYKGRRSFIYLPSASILKVNEIARKYREF